MFTGIIEHIGTIESLEVQRDGGRITIHAPSLAGKLAVSNSMAVNGCCLTIVAVDNDQFSADLSGETLSKTSFGVDQGALVIGARVNLEQPVPAGKEFGGHFVLGHVDGTGRVRYLTPEGESWRYGVEVTEDFAPYIVPQGSITVDGISLTVARWHNFVMPARQDLTAEIAVIPFTYEHTNIRDRKPGDAVNLEADILGKYVERYLEARAASRESHLSIQELIEQGF